MKISSYRKIIGSLFIISSSILFMDSSSVKARGHVQAQRSSLPRVNIHQKDPNGSIVRTRDIKQKNARTVAVSRPKRLLRSESLSPARGRVQGRAISRSPARAQPPTRGRAQARTVSRSLIRAQPPTRGRPQARISTRLQGKAQPPRPQARVVSRSLNKVQSPTRGRPQVAAPAKARAQTPPPRRVASAPVRTRAQTLPSIPPRPPAAILDRIRAQNPSLLPPKTVAVAPVRTRGQTPPPIPPRPPAAILNRIHTQALQSIPSRATTPAPATRRAQTPPPIPPRPANTASTKPRIQTLPSISSKSKGKSAPSLSKRVLNPALAPDLTPVPASAPAPASIDIPPSEKRLREVSGRVSFTQKELTVASWLNSLCHSRTPFTLAEFNAGQRLHALYNTNFSLDELQVASHLIALGKIDFTNDDLAVGKRLLAIEIPQFTEDELRAGQRLDALYKINFSIDELQAASHLIALGKIDFTNDDLFTAQHLVSHYGKDQFTEREFRACQQLRTLDMPYASEKYLTAAEKLISLGRVNINRRELDVAQSLVALGIEQITEATLDAANLLRSRWMSFNATNIIAVARLIQNNHREFSDEDIIATQRLIILGRDVISSQTLAAAKRLIYLGNSTFTNPQLEAAGELMRFRYRSFTQNMVNAALRLREIGRQNFSEDHLWLAQRLMGRRNREFSAAEFSLALAPPPPPRPAPAAPGGAAVPAAAAPPPLPVRDWTPLTPAERLDDFLHAVTYDDVLLENTGFSIGNIDRVEWKNLVVDLMTTGEIPPLPLPAVRPPSLRMLVAQSSVALNKALSILRCQRAHGFNRAEAREFLAFQSKLDSEAGNFIANLPYTFTPNQKVGLFRKLRAACQTTFGNLDQFPKYQAALFTILSHSLPIDYPTWPANEDGNCDNFIGQVVIPALTTAAEDNMRALHNLSGTGLVYGLSQTDPTAIIPTIERIVTERLQANDRNYKAKIVKNLNNFKVDLQLKQDEQLGHHGHKFPANNGNLPGALTFHNVTAEVREWLRSEETRCRANRNLRTHINYQHLCRDPALAILSAPDEKLQQIMRVFTTAQQEINALKALVRQHLSADLRGDDDAFNNSFSSNHYGLAENNQEVTRLTVGRVRRLYEAVKASVNEADAAKVVYYYGIANDGRCIDGKRDGLLDLERKYVYVAGGNDRDAVVASTCAKLFMDDRLDTVRKASDNTYPSGENRTYCAFNTSRAIALGFGLPITYEDSRYNFTAHINGKEFVEKYFKGGKLLGQDIHVPRRWQGDRWIPKRSQTLTHNFQPFTVDRMIFILREEVGKAMGGSFDDKTLDHMVNSDLALRKAYTDFKNQDATDPNAANYQNAYFKDATKPLRKALKDEAYIKVLHRYGYVSVRENERSPWN